jgi:hypothetical protein
VNFEGVSAQHVAILAVIEMAVIALSVLLAHLIYRRLNRKYISWKNRRITIRRFDFLIFQKQKQ